jgi:hypothetical protein
VGLAQHDGARGIGESHTIEGQRLEVNDSVSMPSQSGNGVLKLAISLGLGDAEDGGEAACRKRLILTHRVTGLARDLRNGRALLWNPAGATFEDARCALGAADGVLAVIGGANVFGLFLEIGYDSFHLSRANNVRLPTDEGCFRRPGLM